MKSICGAVPVIVLYLVGALAATQLVPNWRIGTLFAKAPPTAALREAEEAATKARADAEKARADAVLAQAALAAAQAEQAMIHTQQGQYAQGANAGAAIALAAVPAEHQTPEVKVAEELVNRATYALDAAFGKLPADQVAQWKALTAAALAAQGKEIATLKAALADKDAALQVTIKEKAELAVKVPLLEDQVKTTTARAEAAQVKATTKTEEAAGLAEKVADAADKLADKEKEAGSLGALVKKLGYVLLAVGILYVFAHFMLPSLAQEFPAATWLNGLNKTVKSISSAHL